MRGLGICESLLANGLDRRGCEGVGEGVGEEEGESGLSLSFFSGGTNIGNPPCAFGCVLCLANPRVKSFRFKLLCFGLVGTSLSGGVDFDKESLLKSNLNPSLEGGAFVGVVEVSLAGGCGGVSLGGILSGGMANFRRALVGRGVALEVSEGRGGDRGGLSCSEVAKFGKGGLELSNLMERLRLGESRLKSDAVESRCRVVGLSTELFELLELFEIFELLEAEGAVVLRVRALGEEEEEGDDRGEGRGDDRGEGRGDGASFGGVEVSRGFSVGMLTMSATGGLVNARRLV